MKYNKNNPLLDIDKAIVLQYLVLSIYFLGIAFGSMI